MSFHEVPRKRPGATLGRSMTAALYRAGRGSSFRLLLGRELIDRLGWDDEVRLRLLFGDGADQGRARLERARQGGSRLLRPAADRNGGGCLVFSTQRLPQGATRRPHSAAAVAYELAEDAIEFCVPDWFYAQPRRP